MSVNYTKGMWQLRPEAGEIYVHNKEARTPLAQVSGLSFPERDYEECIANAAVISHAAEMYSLLIFIKSALQCMYNNCPVSKGTIFEYIEGRINRLESEVEKLAAYRRQP